MAMFATRRVVSGTLNPPPIELTNGAAEQPLHPGGSSTTAERWRLVVRAGRDSSHSPDIAGIPRLPDGDHAE
jgi:hypothetical protein